MKRCWQHGYKSLNIVNYCYKLDPRLLSSQLHSKFFQIKVLFRNLTILSPVAMSVRRKLYLFDVDGTLTEPRRKISEDLKTFLLDTARQQVKVGLVSGSDYSKIAEQMTGEEVISKFDYVFCENGLVYYQNGKLLSQQSILDHLGEEKLQLLINFALGYMSKIKLPAKRGNFIEFRTGMINLCPVGRSCSQSERDEFAKYDATYHVRKQFVEELKKEFSDMNLTFAIGGQISIDVFPQGWDKTFCLNHLEEEQLDEIHFFGDKTDCGGNDYEIFSHGKTIGHTVTSPQDTKQQIMKFLDIHN